MQQFISPSYTHEKLERATLSDLVDVFEDLWIKFIFEQAELLLKNENGYHAAMAVLSSYFEAIESHYTGISSKNKSSQFFINGFCRVFKGDQPGIEHTAKQLYASIRCGLAHEGFVRSKVHYSPINPNAFICTYKKKSNGSLDIEAGMESVVVNPYRFYECLKLHFNKYLGDIRNPKNIELRSNFETTVNSLWAIGTEDNVIGMTKEEFSGGV